MTTYTWPNTGRHRPEDAAEHLACLKADLDLVSDTANASLSNTTLLPSGLESKISIGIVNGIAEACSKGYLPKWSEIDKSIFSKVMLKNIATAAALEARDRIPLPQFFGVHESFNTLYPKFATQKPPTKTTHQFVGAGTATEATSVVDLVKAARKTNNETDLDRTSKRATIQQDEKAYDVIGEECGTDDSVECEESEEESEDESEDESEEEIEEENEEESEENSETGSDAGSGEGNNQEFTKEESVPRIFTDGSDFSSTVKLEIEQQASVNRLEGMTTLELSNYLSYSLRKFLRKQQASSRSVHISSVSLLDTGNVKVVLYAESREALQQVVDPAGWHQDFEKSLIGSTAPTYKIRMHEVEINSLKFQTRMEKSAIIRKLAGVNRTIAHGISVSPSIIDIRWSQYSSPKIAAALIVEFLDPDQATQILMRGLCWQERRHHCERADGNRMLLRCIRCQDYGHLFDKCSAPHQCGKCAGQHPTTTCESQKVKCATCGGGHRAGKYKCPAKAEARRSLGFMNENASQASKPLAEAQETPSSHTRHSISAARSQTETSMPSPVSLDDNSAEDEIKSEPEQSLPEADPTQDTYPDTVTLLKKIDDLRKIVVVRDTALQFKSSGPPKRRAGEAFEGGAEAESSNVAAKRIKKEQPTREDPMGLWRQPSPYIINPLGKGQSPMRQ